MEKFTRHEAEAAALTAAVINGIVDSDAIWCFGIRSQSGRVIGGFYRQPETSQTHLYLLVFAAATQPGSMEKIEKAMAKKSAGAITATVLLYQTSKLSRVKGNHRCFLREVTDFGESLYRRTDCIIPEFVTIKLDVSAKKDYWNHCKYMATCCLEAETAIENPNAEPMQAVLLHQATEQICLGLIYAFLGCRPNHYALGYLLDFCELFLPDVTDIFPRQSIEEKARFSKLELRMESLRYRLSHPSITDIEILRSRVHSFLALGEKEAGKKFNEGK